MSNSRKKELQSYIKVNSRWVAETLFSHSQGDIGFFDAYLKEFVKGVQAHFMRLYEGCKNR